MKLNIEGRQALVCGASKGLGFGCAQALAEEGAHITLVARGEEALKAAESELRARGHSVRAISADVTTESGRAAILEQMPAADILVNNAGGPPPGNFRDWSRDDWIAAFDANMLSAVFLTRAYVDGMIERRFGRIVNITSIAIKQPQSLLGLSTSARLALTGFAVSLGRETVRHNVTVNNLLPGYFDTGRLRRTFDAWAAAGEQPDEVAEKSRTSIPAQRFGTVREFGEMCAFLCGSGSGYITGQNILLDGGLYSGLL